MRCLNKVDTHSLYHIGYRLGYYGMLLLEIGYLSKINWKKKREETKV